MLNLIGDAAEEVLKRFLVSEVIRISNVKRQEQTAGHRRIHQIL
jgi:hypothetical protein